ncbi:MAG: hypothetical protein AAGD11_02355 [Planctomycetota bacterium]
MLFDSLLVVVRMRRFAAQESHENRSMPPLEYCARRILQAPLVLIAAIGCQSLPTGVDAPLFQHQTKRDQIVLLSNFDVPTSDELLVQLARQREVVSHALDLPPTNTPIHVHLFRDDSAYYDFLARRFPGFPQRRAIFVETENALSVYAHWSDQVVEDLRHEVTHGCLHAAVPNIPLWLDEGLAEYFEVGADAEGLNQLHLDHLTNLANFQPNLQRLENLHSAADMTQLDYAESWAWTHFLLSAEPESQQLLVSHVDALRLGNASKLASELSGRFSDPNTALKQHLRSLR